MNRVTVGWASNELIWGRQLSNIIKKAGCGCNK
jgi:hypothetical protein